MRERREGFEGAALWAALNTHMAKLLRGEGRDAGSALPWSRGPGRLENVSAPSIVSGPGPSRPRTARGWRPSGVGSRRTDGLLSQSQCPLRRRRTCRLGWGWPQRRRAPGRTAHAGPGVGARRARSGAPDERREERGAAPLRRGSTTSSSGVLRVSATASEHAESLVDRGQDEAPGPHRSCDAHDHPVHPRRRAPARMPD